VKTLQHITGNKYDFDMSYFLPSLSELPGNLCEMHFVLEESAFHTKPRLSQILKVNDLENAIKQAAPKLQLLRLREVHFRGQMTRFQAVIAKHSNLQMVT